MAGAGYKLFNTGDVLTAAQVNTYLNEQTVMVFASSAARTSALSGVLAEGMMSYLQDTNAVEVYNGSAWTAVGGGGLSSPLTTKGDVWGYSTTNARIPVGANGTVLTADSAETLGVKWAAASATSGPAFRANRTANYSISQNTWTKVNYNEEDFDTAGNYDPTTNFRFTPTTAGYYQFNYEGQIVGTEGQLMTIALYKNGASYHSGSAVDISGQGYGQVSSSDLVYMNGSSDYVEVYLYTSASGANIGGNATGNVSVFSGVWIRS